ncbi:tetratricopeptide repeat protein [Alkanindiges sp. WGS2144]|uniref:tetratricopeptide repeat protein n=1 Tax=Alkanindiges sp. WGS2144 TaxID=3366808 RepID=UPI00375217CD
MKKSYLYSLICASALFSACTIAPPKQVIETPLPAPEPQPVVLQKVEPEISPPHYRLNPKNYFSPLNPILVQEIKEALTPKIINPTTGEVVSRLPIQVPGQTTSAQPTTTTAAASAQATGNPASIGNDQTKDAVTGSTAETAQPELSQSEPAQQENQSPELALLKIDPALKLDEQALAALNAASEDNSNMVNLNAPVTTTGTSANTESLDTQSDATTPDAVTGNTASTDQTAATGPSLKAALAKILIPLHQQLMTKSISTPSASDEKLDVTELDKDILLLEGKARHYPAYFNNKIERVKAEKKIRQITQKLDVLAVDPRASYDVLLRAMKAHVLARNMDAGPDSAFKSAVYFQRLLKLKPADPETSFWYGFSLGEGGGFRESISHLDTAVKADYQEAYLALAHSYLQMGDKKNALTMLNNYKIKFPDDSQNTERLIAEIQAGQRYSIWR